MISVIVPIYNVEKYLSRCVDSILKQTFTDFEVILVDDGSTDDSGRIADEYNSDEHVTVIHQYNQGLSAARNVGLLVSKGEYVCFIDSDDLVAPNYLETLYKTAVKFNSDLVLGDYREIDENDNVLDDNIVNGNELIEAQLESQTKPYGEGLIPKDVMWEDLTKTYLNHYSICLVVAWNKLIKRELALNNFFEVGKKHEDEFWIMPLLLEAKTVTWNDNVVYHYRMRSDSIIHNRVLNYEKEIEVLDAYEMRIELAAENDIPVKPFVKSYFENINNMKNLFNGRNDLAGKNCKKVLAKRTRDALIKYGKELSLMEFVRIVC